MVYSTKSLAVLHLTISKRKKKNYLNVKQ
uniref:Uncharacterized protein n=1 Tax=Anguilla anguilla TaxID=7936 RepID=A0A0E9TY49_ANGAN